MTQLNTAADISAFVNTIYQEAMLTAREQSIMANLVTIFNDRSGTAGRSNSVYSGGTISTPAETDDLTSQAFTPAAIATLTPIEYATQYFITDLRVESDQFNVITEAGQDLGQLLAEAIDTALIGELGSLTGGTAGVAGSAMTLTYFTNAITLLRSQKPLGGKYIAVFGPFQWEDLVSSLGSNGNLILSSSQAAQNSLMSSYYMGDLLGVSCYVDANMASGTAATAGLFTKPAIGLDVRRPMRIAPQRDESRRGLELNMSCVFDAGVWRPKFGVKIIADNT